MNENVKEEKSNINPIQEEDLEGLVDNPDDEDDDEDPEIMDEDDENGGEG